MESDASAKKEYQRLRCNNKAAADGTSREAAHTAEADTAVDNRADTDTADSKAGAEQEADTAAGDSNRNTTEMTPPDGIKVTPPLHQSIPFLKNPNPPHPSSIVNLL